MGSTRTNDKGRGPTPCFSLFKSNFPAGSRLLGGSSRENLTSALAREIFALALKLRIQQDNELPHLIFLHHTS